VAAMVMAPFIALLYGTEFGLGVLAVTLGATAFLALDAGRFVDGIERRRLYLLAALNGLLGIIVLAAVIVLVF
jgi:hypothetical protein